MSKLEQLQNEINQLVPSERRALMEWLEELVSDDWDRQIEADVLAGKLDKLAEQAREDIKAGRIYDAPPGPGPSLSDYRLLTDSRMSFDLSQAITILERTPAALNALLRDLPTDWTTANEGPDTWSAFDIVGHLIHGEETDWIPRATFILGEGEARPFEPFDRFAQLEISRGKKLAELLDTFAQSRAGSLEALHRFDLTEADLDRTGQHPALGRVTLRELLATWVVHDLNHLAQIARVMSRQYAAEVGPWQAYLGILGR